MTIETTSAQNTSRPAATESKHAKGKPGDAHGHGSGGPGGFMAILASMDTSELVAPTGADVLNSPGALALAALQRAAAALKGKAGDADAMGLGDAAGDTDLSTTEADLAKLLQGDEVTIAAGLPPPIDVPRQPDLPVDTSALLAQAAQWNAVPVANPEQSNPKTMDGIAASLSGAAKPVFGADKPEGTAIANAALGEVVSELAGKVGKAQKDAATRLAAAQAAMAEPAASSNPAAEARHQAQVLQKVVEAPVNPVTTAQAAATVAVPGRREDLGRERSVFRSTAPETASPLQTYAPSASAAGSVNAPAPVTSMETYVAEKVAYWISNDVQNAEMKLDGIGELPVEVSIRMQGNEAHIAFRSDELQAREALENAGLHLKEMLQREGLVLSGVSVGTAGAGDAGGQERQPRQGARQSGVVSVQPARTDGVAHSRRSTGGALDLFV
jgi:flagellar hook-length control protein FliK